MKYDFVAFTVFVDFVHPSRSLKIDRSLWLAIKAYENLVNEPYLYLTVVTDLTLVMKQ